MIVGGIRLITYDSDVILKSAPHGVSVTAAPPVTSRASSTTVRRPGPGEVGGGDETVVAAADHDRLVRLVWSLGIVGSSLVDGLIGAGTAPLMYPN